MLNRLTLRVIWLVACVFTGVVFGQEKAPVVRFTVEQFMVEGDNPLSADETERVLSPYTGEHAGLEGLLSAAEALEQTIADRGFSFRRVLLPAQTLRDGVVKLRVVAFPLGKVTVTGNRYFSDENVLASVPSLQVGTVPNTRQLTRAVSLANEHPVKHITLSFKESEEENTIDAELKVKDAKPWQFIANLNDTGTEETGELRLSLGYQHSNLFHKDHMLSLAFGTSPGHGDDVQLYGVNYLVPQYKLKGALSFYAVSSTVDSGTVGNFTVSGAGEFFGGRYAQTLRKFAAYGHKLVAGIDSKLFENDIAFLGTPIGIDVRSRPASLRYLGSYRTRRVQSDFYTEYARNIPGGSDGSQLNYTLTRFGADRDWDAVRLGGNFVSPFKRGWAVRAVADGQLGNEPLIPGEQFGLGGINSVRGFEEREVTGDNGFRLSFELWGPPIRGVRLLGFVEGGHAVREDPLPGEITRQTISSTGIGLRWQWRQNVGVRLDLAHVIDGTLTTPDDSQRAHFNIFGRY